MSLLSSQSILCPSCGKSDDIKIYSSINVREDPDLKEKVSDGSLFVWTCPTCGHRTLLRYPVLYHDPESRLMIWLTYDKYAESQAKKVFDGMDSLNDYTGRLVGDVGSLIEKVHIFDCGLNDLAVEMCKYVIRQEKGSDLSLKFIRMDGAEGDLIFTYPKDGQMEMLAVGLNVYEDCVGILKRNPDVESLSKGLVRIDEEWTETVIR